MSARAQSVFGRTIADVVIFAGMAVNAVVIALIVVFYVF